VSSKRNDETDALIQQACDWLSKLYSGHFDKKKRAQLNAWRKQSPAHEKAWQKTHATWQHFNLLKNPIDLPSAQALPREFLQEKKPARIPRPLTFAACALTLVLLFTVLIYPPIRWQADYVTSTGEIKQIHLADGSNVTLNTHSAIAVHYSAQLRKIELLEGEAFFEVAKDAVHPFIVEQQNIQVRAVGTAFTVYAQNDETQVDLLEGHVEVSAGQSTPKKYLHAGQRAVISANPLKVDDAQILPENMALWREGYLQLDNLSLQEAVAQLNRYFSGKVMLINPAFANKKVSGIFRIDSLNHAITSFSTALPSLHVVKLTPYFILLC
jgi:transmembrane sensor